MSVREINLLVAGTAEAGAVIEAVLQDAPFSVSMSRVDSQQGLRQALKSQHWDVAVSELEPGDFTAHDVQILLGTQATPTPLILIAETGSEDIALRCLASGVDQFLPSDARSLRRLPILIELLLQRARNELERQAVEQALRESEERYSDIVEHTSDLVQCLLPDGSFVFTNHAWQAAMGYTAEEAMNLKLSDVLHPDSMVCCQHRFERLQQGEPLSCVDFKFISRSGDTIHLQGDCGSVMREGAVLFTRGVFRNITGQVRAEAALQQSERRYQALYENAPDIYSTIDASGAVVSFNRSGARMLGYEVDELVGRSAVELIHPDDRARVFEYITRQFHDFRVDDGIEYRKLKKDGSPIWLHQRVSLQGDGDKTKMLVICRDITERLEADAELRRHRDRLEELVAERTEEVAAQARIIDQIHDSVVATDLDGMVTSWNRGAERLFGFSAEEMIGKPIASVYPEDQLEHLASRVIAPLKEKGEHLVDVCMLRKSGERFTAQVSLSMLYDKQGKPNGMIGYSIDITERKRAEAALEARTVELEEAIRELESFSYSVSHDLRSPLRAINGFTYGILEDYGECIGDDGREDLQRVIEASRKMGELIDDLLDLTRVTRAPMRREDVDIGVLSHQIADELQHAGTEREVSFDIAKDLHAWSDPGLVRIVLMNLLTNAWKFTSEKSEAKIEVGKTESPEGRAFFVRDNGVGFDMRFADKLFGTFQRLHRSDEFEGTGIGLATVKRIINRHGGEVWAESAPGQGATFYFNFG